MQLKNLKNGMVELSNSERAKVGIMDVISEMKHLSNTDKELLVQLKQIKSAIKNKSRKDWPNKNIRKLYNLLDNVQKQYFDFMVDDMIEGLEIGLND